MEIIKIFSEIDTSERLYSVLMSEEELDFFQREFGNAANKAAKRAWEASKGQRTGLSRLIKGKLPESEAIRLGRLKNKSSVIDNYALIGTGGSKYSSLNHKINAKGSIEPSSRGTLREFDQPLNRGKKIYKGSKPSNNSVYKDGSLVDWRKELIEANKIGIRK